MKIMKFFFKFNIKLTVNDINRIVTIEDNSSSVLYDDQLKVYLIKRSLVSDTHDYLYNKSLAEK